MSSILILIFLILIIVIIVVIKFRKYNVVYVASDVDNNTYLVRDVKDKQDASNLLGKIRKNIFFIVEHLYANKDDKYLANKQYIEQLNKRIRNVEIMESSEDSIYTSYSVNKGEQIVFCLRSRNTKDKLHDMNILMYVVLHEMSHVACPEMGHTDLFKKIFAFITNVAIELGLYTKLDFIKNPTEYCGLLITESIV